MRRIIIAATLGIMAALGLGIFAGKYLKTERALETSEAPSVEPGVKLLSGVALERALDERYGIWFIGENLPLWAQVSLRENAMADEAVELVRAALKREMGGLQIVEVGHSKEKVYQVIAAGAKVVPYEYGRDAAHVPPTEDVVGWVVPVRNLAVGPLRIDLAPLMGDVPNADARHNCLIVEGSAAKIHRLVEITAALDSGVVVHHMEVRELTSLKAADVARVITDKFRQVQSARGGRGVPSDRGYADFDQRTNSVVVSGPEDLVKQAIEIIEQMEKDASAKAGEARK